MNPRIAVALVAVVAVAALFFVFRPEGDDEAMPTQTSTAATPPTLEPAPSEEPVSVTIQVVGGGEPVSGLTRIEAKKGDRIVLIVQADSADRVHVHGYDLFGDVGPGRPASLRFRATITGRFEIELEDAHQQIAQLTVAP